MQRTSSCNVNTSIPPPLIIAKSSQPSSQNSIPNIVNTGILKNGQQIVTANPVTLPHRPIQLLQTADGKNILLTTAVPPQSCKTPPNNLVLLLQNDQGKGSPSSRDTNIPPNKSQIVLLKTASNQSSLFSSDNSQTSSISQQLFHKQIRPLKIVRDNESSEKTALPPTLSVVNDYGTSISFSNTDKGLPKYKGNSQSSLVNQQVIHKQIKPLKNGKIKESLSYNFIQNNNGMFKYKVVGNPVPVRINSRNLSKIAPKILVYNPSANNAMQSREETSKNAEIIPFIIPQIKESDVIGNQDSINQEENIVTSPPYLNMPIKEEEIKREPKEEPTVHEKPEAFNIGLQNEHNNDHENVVETDGQSYNITYSQSTKYLEEKVPISKDVDDVENKYANQKTSAAKLFGIRTKEDKIINLSSEQIKALGLNFLDEYNVNEQRFINSISPVLKETEMEGLNSTLAPTSFNKTPTRKVNKKIPAAELFGIQTKEGMKMNLSSEQAKAMRLNFVDERYHGERKFINSISSFLKETEIEALNSELAPKCFKKIQKIPSVTELVHYNVPKNVKEASDVRKKYIARKNLSIIEHIHNESGVKNVKVSDLVYRNVPNALKNAADKIRLKNKTFDSEVEVNNRFIIGEFSQQDKRFLKIKIEAENFESDTCDIPISCFNAYVCPFCRKEFKSKHHVICHIRVHTGERPYPCEICGKRYRQRIDIIRHIRIHTREKPFECEICNTTFNQKSNLRSHMRIHTGERPVICKICGKRFSRRTHLKQHTKLHTGEKPFKCKVCERPFRFKSGVQAHERIHSGLKPYACRKCGRSFTQIVGLIRHERTHVTEKCFRCEICGLSFAKAKNLFKHRKKHDLPRIFTCKTCPKTFTDTRSLQSHVKKYHSTILKCVLCPKDHFKSRIELREHLREHEREKWKDTFPNVESDSWDDNTTNYNDKNEAFENMDYGGSLNSEGHVVIELDPDDPMAVDGDFSDDDEFEHDPLA